MPSSNTHAVLGRWQTTAREAWSECKRIVAEERPWEGTSCGRGVIPSPPCVIPSPTRVLLSVSDDPEAAGLTFNSLPLI